MVRHFAIWLALGIIGLALGHPGNGIVALPDGSAITGDAVGNGMWHFRRGMPPRRIASDFHSHWLTKGLDGVVYAESSAYESESWIVRVSKIGLPSGQVSSVWSSRDLSQARFAVDRQGRVVVLSGGRLMSRGPGGDLAPFRGDGRVARGDPALTNVEAFAWGPNDSLYLCDGPRIRRVGDDGQVLVMATFRGGASLDMYSAPGGGLRLWGISVDNRGRVFAADASNGRVMQVEPDGSSRAIATAVDGWVATGVSVAGGRTYLLESKLVGNRTLGPRVRVLDGGGRSDILGIVE